MTAMTEYERRLEERNIISKETKKTIIISVALLFSCGVMALAAHLLQTKPTMTASQEETVYGIVNLLIVLIIIGMLAVRRSVYYSPRLIKEDFTLTQVMRQWRKVDFTLLSVAETIPICGLVLTFLGVPFDKTFHLFLGAGLLMIILMPVGIKVRSKLSILKEHFPENEFV
jgi:hypothetical protein